MSVTSLSKTVERLIDGGPRRLAGGTQSQANTTTSWNPDIVSKTNNSTTTRDIRPTIQGLAVMRVFGGLHSGHSSRTIFNNDTIPTRVRLTAKGS